MTDLLSAVIALEPLEACTLDPFQGRAMHALFLDLTARHDGTLAAALHDGEGLKPFTSSNLAGLRLEEGGRASAAAGQLLRWRITAFEAGLARLWLDKVLPALPSMLTVGDLPLAVRGWTADAAQDSWAGVSSYAELARRHTLSDRPPAPWINLRFASPTSFRSDGVHVPLPLPKLMLGHWLDKWNAFAPTALPAEARELADTLVAVNRYDLHTEPVLFGKATIIGFVGQCSLAVRHEDPYWRRIPGLLAAFSFWCGTGHRTPYGLGQTRPGR